MGGAEKLITENIALWTLALKKKNGVGRGSSKKIDLYGIKKLRALILELAVRGKLVPQDPADEPASKLLERIAAEKARLVKEKKIKKPKLLFTISDDEKNFRLPDGWAWCRFGDATYNRDAERVPLSVLERQKRSGEYDYYGASGVIDSIDNYLFEQPLLLIGEDGANLINRSTPIAFMAYGKYWVNNHAHVIDGITEDFLLFLCLHINAISLEQYVTGTAQPKMNQAKMNTILLGIPPEAEQHRIVAKVDELMALCDRLEEQTEASISAHALLVENLLNTLTQSADAADLEQNWTRIAAHFTTLFTTEASIDRLKQTILQLAVMGKLVPQDTKDEPASVLLEKIAAEKAQLIKEKKIKRQKPLLPIGEDETPFALPGGWEYCRLDDLALTSEAGWSPRCQPNKREGDKWGVLKVSAVTWGVFKPEENKELPQGLEPRPQYEVKSGDFLISRANTAALVARAVVVPSDVPIHLMMSDKIIRFNFTDKVSNDYVNLANNSLFSRIYYGRVAGGTSSSMKNVSRNQVRNLVIMLPSFCEQLRIIKKTNELIDLCDQIKSRLHNAQQTQLLLADVVTGQFFGHQSMKKEQRQEVQKNMKIFTLLTLGSLEPKKDALLAVLVQEAGEHADAKSIWSKSKLSLPEFYLQLKKEIDAGYLAMPAQADFEL